MKCSIHQKSKKETAFLGKEALSLTVEQTPIRAQEHHKLTTFFKYKACSFDLLLHYKHIVVYTVKKKKGGKTIQNYQSKPVCCTENPSLARVRMSHMQHMWQTSLSTLLLTHMRTCSGSNVKRVVEGPLWNLRVFGIHAIIIIRESFSASIFTLVDFRTFESYMKTYSVFGPFIHFVFPFLRN